MKIIEDVCAAPPSAGFSHVVLTVGSFDGVHLGHQRVLEQVVQTARAAQGTAAVMTLQPHPRQVFSPQHAANLLTSEEKKRRLLEAAGADALFYLKFDQAVAQMEPAVFVEEIIGRRCGAKHVIVGHDFRFGLKAQGDYAFLEKMARALGFQVSQVPPLVVEGERVSSTLIREYILEGDLEQAEKFLGRPYSILAPVVRGRGIGSQLGFPTANIEPRDNAIPAQGVYVAEVIVADRLHPAAVNIGIAPTIRHEDIMVEAHILDFSQDIVGATIEVIFRKRLRPEKKFPSREALVTQIARDVDEVRAYFRGVPAPGPRSTL